MASVTHEQRHRLITSMPRRIDAVIQEAPTKIWVHKWTHFFRRSTFLHYKSLFWLFLCNILIFWDTTFFEKLNFLNRVTEKDEPFPWNSICLRHTCCMRAYIWADTLFALPHFNHKVAVEYRVKPCFVEPQVFFQPHSYWRRCRERRLHKFKPSSSSIHCPLSESVYFFFRQSQDS